MEFNSSFLVSAARQIFMEPQGMLVFKGPFNEAKNIDVKVTNMSQFRIAFKFRTTRPDGIKFRPPMGILSPGGEKYIRIRCLPISGELPTKDRCTLHCVALPPNYKCVKPQDFWKSPDSKNVTTERYPMKVIYEGVVPPTAEETTPSPAVAAPAEVKPADEAKPVEEAKPAEEAKPVEEAKPAEEVKPVEEAKPTEEENPPEEAKPAEGAAADEGEEGKPVEEAAASKPAEEGEDKAGAKEGEEEEEEGDEEEEEDKGE
ncbi:Myosin light chain kinase,smooth muscle [Trichinella pseudospiralis]